MLFKVNCQRYAYKLSLSHPAPLPLIQRHKQWVGRGWGSWLPLNLLADSLMVLCLHHYLLHLWKPFLFALSKPHFYLHLMDCIKSKGLARGMTLRLCPLTLSGFIPFHPLQHRQGDPLMAPPWLLSASWGSLSALTSHKKARVHLGQPDSIKTPKGIWISDKNTSYAMPQAIFRTCLHNKSFIVFLKL